MTPSTSAQPHETSQEPDFLEFDNAFEGTNDFAGRGTTGDGASGAGRDASSAEKSARVQEFGSCLQSNFEKLDKDGNGKLTVAEIEQNMLDPKVAHGKDAANLAALRQNVDNIAHATSGKNAEERRQRS
jgi:hypothetical protein